MQSFLGTVNFFDDLFLIIIAAEAGFGHSKKIIIENKLNGYLGGGGIGLAMLF